MNDKQPEIDHPFKHIALSLSGGGVRAVGYHLGTLDYLNHLGMLSEVHTLSSVSGGSLVGIGYALSLKKGESFQEFYDNVCEFLPELNTLEELLEILNRKAPPVASGSRTLVTAMAQVYRENYFDRYYGDPQFGIFWDEDPEIPLKEIIFNATEFKSGIAFRFQKSQYASLIGNGKVWIDEKFAKQIRMSDIMAASSCIPVAMEPLMFPQDFHWPDDPKDGGTSPRPTCEALQEHLLDQVGDTTVPLMDGGVYDNQGISSIVLTVARKHREMSGFATSADEDQAGLEPVRPQHWARWVLSSMEKASDVENQKDMGDVDLFIVSDTPVRRDPMYSAETPNDVKRSRFRQWLRQLRLGTIDKFVWAITIILAASIFALLNAPTAESLPYKIFYRFETVFLAFLAAIAAYGLYQLRRKGEELAARTAKQMPPMGRSMWSYAKMFRLGTLIDMLALRASSMSALTARIFMNRIRQLGYSLLYSHEEFRKRVMDNNINDIKTLREGRSGDLPPFLRDTSELVEKVVERASEMGTKLWIDKPKGEHHDLDVLVAAGHLSTCFNIIEFIWENHRDEKGDLNDDVVELFDSAKSDWLALNQNPYLLVDRRKEDGKSPGNLFWTRPEYTKKLRGQRRWSRSGR